MAAILELASVASAFGPATRWQALAETLIQSNTTEAPSQMARRSAGTFSGMYVRVTVNAYTGTSTLQFRKNTANGNQTIAIGAGLTGEFQDSTNTDSVVAGDIVSAQISGGAGGNITFGIVGILFSATSGTVKRMAQWATVVSSTSLLMYPVTGPATASANATDAAVSFTVGTPGKLQNLYVRVISNTNSVSTSVTTRVNGGAGNCSVTIGSALTGVFEDTSNTDSVVAGDTINYGFNGGAGTGSCNFRTAVEFFTNSNQSHFISGGGSNTTQLKAVTTNYPLGGNLTADTTEANVQAKAQIPMLLSGLQARVVTNTVTATSTLRLRKNAGNGNQSVAIGSSLTGLFQDTTNTDSVTATDELNYQLVTGSTGTSMVMGTIGVLAANMQNVPPYVPYVPLTPFIVQ